jgi:hypothetical protein
LKTNKRVIEECFSGKVTPLLFRTSLNVHRKLYFIGKELSTIAALLKIKNRIKVQNFLKIYSQDWEKISS